MAIEEAVFYSITAVSSIMMAQGFGIVLCDDSIKRMRPNKRNSKNQGILLKTVRQV